MGQLDLVVDELGSLQYHRRAATVRGRELELEQCQVLELRDSVLVGQDVDARTEL